MAHWVSGYDIAHGTQLDMEGPGLPKEPLESWVRLLPLSLCILPRPLLCLPETAPADTTG